MLIDDNSLILVESRQERYGVDRYLVTGRTARDLIFGRVTHGTEACYTNESVTVFPAYGYEIKYTHAEEGDLKHASSGVTSLADLLRSFVHLDDDIPGAPVVALAMRIMYNDLPWSDALNLLYQIEEEVLRGNL